MSETSLFMYNEKWGRAAPRVLTLNWKITGAVTIVTLPLGVPVLTAFGAISAQSTIDNFLGTTSEFDYLAFDATSMGTDGFGVIIDMKGQAARVDGFSCKVHSGTGGKTVYNAGAYNAGITATTLESACARGASGNIAVKCSFDQAGAVDALTAGMISMQVFWSAIK